MAEPLPTCLTEDCEERAVTRGFCAEHYAGLPAWYGQWRPSDVRNLDRPSNIVDAMVWEQEMRQR